MEFIVYIEERLLLTCFIFLWTQSKKCKIIYDQIKNSSSETEFNESKDLQMDYF
jgi:hypothetical protein